jgi:hypothetical protein
VPVKEVLHRTKHEAWGTNTYIYRTAIAFVEESPRRLQSAGPRVPKQNSGHGSQGVWKVELVSPPVQDAVTVRVLHRPKGRIRNDAAKPAHHAPPDQRRRFRLYGQR